MQLTGETKLIRGSMSAAAIVAALCALLAIAPAADAAKGKGGGDAKAKKTKKDRRPNIVVVMTDDQDMASAAFMPNLQRLIAGQGVSFPNSVTNYSFCCPSRATYFTGQYAKNHGVLSNGPPIGGFQQLAPTAKNLLPVWLQRAGYSTALVGSFMLGYETPKVPPGWTEWHAAYEGGVNHGFLMNENGRAQIHGSPGVADASQYSTDVFAKKAVGVIKRQAPKPNPFYLTVAPFAPHAEAPNICNCENNNPRAAPRHEGAFANAALPKPPSYDESDMSDKPALTAGLSPIGPLIENQITSFYRNRLESLLSVDDMIGTLVKTLRKTGALKNTVFIFTSDNGWLQGEHRWAAGKVLPYEPSIKVPLMIRGPKIPRGVTRDQLVANVDLAPTILNFAKAKARRPLDGRSLRPVISSTSAGLDRGILLESYFNAAGELGPGPQILFQGVRTDRYMYARYSTGEEELYDLVTDPSELQSRHADPAFAGIKGSLTALLARLQACSGASCRAAGG